MFRDEMSSRARPSLDGIAEEVLAKGRRAVNAAGYVPGVTTGS